MRGGPQLVASVGDTHKGPEGLGLWLGQGSTLGSLDEAGPDEGSGSRKAEPGREGTGSQRFLSCRPCWLPGGGHRGEVSAEGT